ncbi:MAG: helix-turn-helix transcriptional regulator [Clostridia bacterium]|nr:helix-turn-helix transcriptional regulator [Clostridia bacterium]
MRKYNGKSNLSGLIIEEYRKKEKMSREDLARRLQLLGLNIDRTTILRAEKQSTILKDFELIAIMKILKIDYKDLEKEFDKAQQKS